MLKVSLGGTWQTRILAAIILLPFLPVQVQAQTVERIGIPLFEVSDLTHGPDDVRHGVIAVSGILRCSGPSTCWFEHPTNSARHVEVDVSQISSRERQHFHGCIASPCGELLVGFVDLAKRGIRFRMLR
jgi:hypothetical protein